MAGAFFLSFQIKVIMIIGRKLMGNTLDHLNTAGFKPSNFFEVVGQEFYRMISHLFEHLSGWFKYTFITKKP